MGVADERLVLVVLRGHEGAKLQNLPTPLKDHLAYRFIPPTLRLPTASVKPPQNPASKGKYEPYRDAEGCFEGIT